MIISLLPTSLMTHDLLSRVQHETGEMIHPFHHGKDSNSLLSNAEILITLGNIEHEMLNACDNLKWLFSLSAGVDQLPFGELARKGVLVSNVRGIHGTQMAEQTLGMMIIFSRGLHHCLYNQLQKRWGSPWMVNELTDKTLCIIGAGSIGQEIARKAKAFDMKIIGLKKHPENLLYFDEVWGMERLYEALNLADYTVLITPLTNETYHLLGSAEFTAMKREGVFINISRGDTVDEAALISALQNGQIAGAGLDVFHHEPLLPDSPLWTMDNVLITPHSSGKSPHYFQRAMNRFIESLACYRQGKPIPNRIDLDRKY